MSSSRGFTMIELLFAMAIGAFGIAVAATVVQTAVRQSGRGSQVNQMANTARLLGRQIRTDISLAGFGSTGAVAADCGNPLWVDICGQTPNAGFNAIPALRGINDIPSVAIGGARVLDGSDAVQLIVPDPSTLEQTTRSSPSRGQQLFVDNRADGLAGCPLVYIGDHSAPNGNGRTQIMQVPRNGGPNPISRDRLQFPVFEGADVMCARISTWWVDDGRWLHRSDLTPGAAVQPLSGRRPQVTITVQADGSGADRVAPGVLDLQMAYRMSSELLGNRNAPPANRWIFDSDPNGGQALETRVRAQPRSSWFEVRQARVSMLLRTLRSVEDQGDALQEAALGDRLNPIAVPRGYGRYIIRTSAVLTNLRMFDLNAPTGLVAEPY